MAARIFNLQGGEKPFCKYEKRTAVLTEAEVETYLTVKDVADLLQLSVQTIRRYTMNKEIPFYKINRIVRYKKPEIEVWFEKRKAAKVRNKNIGSGLFDETNSGVTP